MELVSPRPRQQYEVPASIPEIGFCREKHRLFQQFIEATRAIKTLQEGQARAAINGDSEFESLKFLLHVAIQKRDTAKYALLGHIESHQCK